MAQDEVARLVAVMEAQLRGFTKGMEQAQRIADRNFGQIERRMNQADRKLSAGFKTIGAGLTRFLSVAAITAFTRSLINTADKLQDTADQIGITTQQLQELQYAARVTGGSAEAIAGSLQTLNDRLGDAAKGEGELAQIMRELNIPMGEAYDVLLDLADATAAAGTQAEKARIATAAFGKAGKDNISFLNQSADGIRRNADEAHRLNQVWTPETIARLNKLKDSFEAISAALANMAAGPLAQALGGLSDFINRLSQGDWADRLQDLTAFFVSLGSLGSVQLPRSDALVDPLIKAQERAAELRKELEQINRLLGRESASRPAWDAWREKFAKPSSLADCSTNSPSEFRDTGAGGNTGGAPPPLPQKAIEAIDVTPINADLQELVRTTGIQLGLYEELQKTSQNAADARREQITAETDALAVLTDGTAAFFDVLREQIDERTTLEITAAEESLQRELARLEEVKNAALAEGVVWADYQEARVNAERAAESEIAAIRAQGAAQRMDLDRRVAEQAQALYLDSADTVIGSLRTIASAAGRENETMVAIAKAAGLAQALISTYVGVAKALELPFPANIAAGAAALAQGLAAVAQIQAVQFHQGGLVGRDGRGRSVSASVFGGAPRLHSGLRPDEFPAILQKGEAVISRADMRARPSRSASGGSTIMIDARGAQKGVGEEIEAAIRRAAPGIVGASVKTGSNFPGMFAEHSKRSF